MLRLLTRCFLHSSCSVALLSVTASGALAGDPRPEPCDRSCDVGSKQVSPAAQMPPYKLLRPVTPPPPGTLGMTYRRPSRPIPIDLHPRIAIVEVFGAPEGSRLWVDEMKGFHDCGRWVFETELPLTPGIPHIYVVRMSICVDGVEQVSERTIRLIPGRVVTLDW